MELEKIFQLGVILGSFQEVAIGQQDHGFIRSPRTELSDLPEIEPLLKEKFVPKKILGEFLNYLKALEELEKMEKKLKKSKESGVLVLEDSDKFFQKAQGLLTSMDRQIEVWKDRIIENLKTLNVLNIATETSIDREKLLIGPKSFFKNDVWDEMEDLEKRDLEDGCQCLLIGAWTPAGMILMRTIEKALRNYYQNLTGNDPKGKNWGPILKELKDISSTDLKLLGYFDHLKDIRNSLGHPDARLDSDQAEHIFNHTRYIYNLLYH